MESEELQQLFFQQIRESLPDHISVVDEIAELLNISNDSAYRRMRGEKPLTLPELKLLCTEYGISIDHLLQMESDVVMFRGKPSLEKQVSFREYLSNLIDQLEHISRFDEKKIYNSAKDIPIFHYFLYPEIAAFKFFFWRRTLRDFELNQELFIIDQKEDELQEMGQKALKLYNQCPSVELWNVETVNSLLQQIKFSVESRLFADRKDIEIIYDRLNELIDHIEHQATKSCKFLPNQSPDQSKAGYDLYFNEVYLGDNTYLVLTGDRKHVYMTYSLIQYMNSADSQFCEYILRSMENLMHKSSLISTVGEKERNRFFNTLREKIAKQKTMVVGTL